MRERELRCACAALGIQPPRLLDYLDGHLAEADPERVIAEILAVIHRGSPTGAAQFWARWAFWSPRPYCRWAVGGQGFPLHRRDCRAIHRRRAAVAGADSEHAPGASRSR